MTNEINCRCEDICEILNDKSDSIKKELRYKGGKDFIYASGKKDSLYEYSILLQERKICDCIT